jgi:3-phosphoshikimate 1-carboxyvinyltransferase
VGVHGQSVSIEPAAAGLSGTLIVPGDKSVSHRSFLIGALAPGRSERTGVLEAEDVARSRALVESLGVVVERTGPGTYVLDVPERLAEPADVIDCGNSGTTIRLATGLLAGALPDGAIAVVTGDSSLRRRPMGRVAEPLARMGARIDGRRGGTLAPLVVRGGPLERVHHALTIASAQVKSAILLAGRSSGTSVEEPRQSRDHTERFLHAMGAPLRQEGGRLVLEPSAPGDWSPVDVAVPGDVSSAAFWLVAASLVPGSELHLPGVGANPSRTGVLDALQAMGADLTVDTDEAGVEPLSTLVVRATGLRGARIDGALALRSLDELPVLAVAAACAEGETVIADAAELRVKESDRIARVVAGLRALGAEVEERPDGMVLAGGGFSAEKQAVVDADGDHRLAMAFAVAGLVSRGGVRIDNADAVQTSYPTFFGDLQRVRGRA